MSTPPVGKAANTFMLRARAIGVIPIVTGVLFVRFSRPNARIAYADNPVITTFNDHRALMIRLANSRLTVMTNAKAKLFALIGEHTKDEWFFRRRHTLPLVQPHLPLFVLPWTLMHVIDETSPLFDYGPTRSARRISACS